MKQLTERELEALIKAALQAAGCSYSPYSRFRVGAALLCADGEIITGTNMENRSLGLTLCAERSAVAGAISLGKKDWQALVLYAPDARAPVPPCGACRQVLTEFAAAEFPVYYTHDGRTVQKSTLGELYPFDSLHELGT